MSNSVTKNKNLTGVSMEKLENKSDMENLSQASLDLLKQIEALALKVAPDEYKLISLDAEDRLIHKLKDIGVALEFYTLTSEERNAADVLASTGEVKFYRNDVGNLELQYKEPNTFEKIISRPIFTSK